MTVCGAVLLLIFLAGLGGQEKKNGSKRQIANGLLDLEVQMDNYDTDSPSEEGPSLSPGEAVFWKGFVMQQL